MGDENNKRRTHRPLEAPNLAAQITQISPGGRYGARRPTCSMAEVFHNYFYVVLTLLIFYNISSRKHFFKPLLFEICTSFHTHRKLKTINYVSTCISLNKHRKKHRISL